MKTRNVDLEHNSLLTNHICKHIVLEAPTVIELQKKVQEYKIILVKALTNAFKLIKLTLDNDGTYHISPTGSYQAIINMTFNGKKKDKITNPEKTLQYVKQLTDLESQRQHESNVIISTEDFTNSTFHTETFTVETDNQTLLDEKICSSQRDFIEGLIAKTNLTQISFLPTAKSQNSKTGKIKLEITANYICKERTVKKAEHTDIDESGNR